tara:strand:+ start:430 stop:885 length:456 start_codon:yes stop_codon:yes gene_type:complete
MKLLIEMILAVTLTMTALVAAHATDVGISVGFWTEHMLNDGPDLNEKNELVQITLYDARDVVDDSRYFTTGGTFINSHYVRSYFAGAGKEFVLIDDTASIGVFIAGVKGYEGHVPTMYKGIIFAPIAYFDYEFVRVTAMGSVVNTSVTYEF